MYLLDCTLRDGGYYNAWDFSDDLIKNYLAAMSVVGVDVVEIGFRSLNVVGYNGPCAYSTDDFLESLELPESLMIGVMINASELTGEIPLELALERLFPLSSQSSSVDLVRIACHVHEFTKVLPVADILKEKGYKVGFNLMQVADRSPSEIMELAANANNYKIDVLYFADSMGSMTPDQVSEIVKIFRSKWSGAMGIHTHDNLGLGVSNTLRAIDDGVTWLDSTVTGMGRGPGNTRTEELAIEIAQKRQRQLNMVPLMRLINQYFKPMQQRYGWGTNPYYYLAGKHGIHPSYIQEMLSDSRYGEEDILAVINYLALEGGKKFNVSTLGSARHFYKEAAKGTWCAASMLENQDVLLLGTGPGVQLHRKAIESFIRKKRPVVIAMNTQADVASELVDLRIACHPVRLLADCGDHTRLPQPLITPFSMLPEDVRQALANKQILDFGMQVEQEHFAFGPDYCVTPTSLVMAYAFAVLASGKANCGFLAGFDGYPGEDPRNEEMNQVVKIFRKTRGSIELIAITPTRYDLNKQSIYGIIQ